MSTNIEPMVNNLMNNKTSSNLMKGFDEDLLNPYHFQTYSNHEHEKMNQNKMKQQQPKRNSDKFENPFENFDEDFNYDEIFKTSKSNLKDNKINENKNDDENMSIMNNIDNIQDIVKNRSISELENIKPSRIDIPFEQQEKYIKHKISKPKRKNIFQSIPINISSFPSANLLNFKEKNNHESIFDT
jgi:hypothetical protein